MHSYTLHITMVVMMLDADEKCAWNEKAIYQDNLSSYITLPSAATFSVQKQFSIKTLTVITRVVQHNTTCLSNRTRETTRMEVIIETSSKVFEHDWKWSEDLNISAMKMYVNQQPKGKAKVLYTHKSMCITHNKQINESTLEWKREQF